MIARILVIALAATGAVLGQTSQPPAPSASGQSTEQQQPAPQQQAEQTNRQPGADLPQTQITIQQTHEAKKDAPESNLAEWVLGFLTIGVAGLQWYVMLGQRNIARKQNEIIEKQSAIMEEQRDAAHIQSGHMLAGLAEARRTADAAMKSARTARQHMVFSLRARFGMFDVSVANGLGANVIPNVVIKIKNFGGKTGVLTDYWFSQSYQVPTAPFPKDRESTHTTHVPIQAGEIYEVNAIHEGPISPAVWDAIAAGKLGFHVYGRFKYQDGFGKSRELRFCRSYSKELTARLGKTTMEIATYCPNGYNDAD